MGFLYMGVGREEKWGCIANKRQTKNEQSIYQEEIVYRRKLHNIDRDGVQYNCKTW